MLQVSVLTEQVEAQAEKLREMEYKMEGKRQRIRSTEEMYQSVSKVLTVTRVCDQVRFKPTCSAAEAS